MDRDVAVPSTDGVRQRRQIPNSDYAEAGPSSRPDGAATIRRSDSTDLAANTENCTNENSENGNVFDEGARSVDGAPTLVSQSGSSSGGGDAGGSGSVAPTVPVPRERGVEFRIKLKYLNDEMKLVKAAPEELIGDFKK